MYMFILHTLSKVTTDVYILVTYHTMSTMHAYPYVHLHVRAYTLVNTACTHAVQFEFICYQV